MRKKIPCKIVGSVPLSIDSNSVVPFKNYIIVLCDEAASLKHVTVSPGATIYTNTLNTINIADDEGRNASVIDSYF